MSKRSKPQTKTPRPYLSYSQLSLWESSKEMYRKRYILGCEISTAYTDLGHEIAEHLENGKQTGDPGKDYLLLVWPRRRYHERTLEAKIGRIPLLGVPDAYTPPKRSTAKRSVPGGVVDEYKTSKNPWTQAKADKNDQLTFYALLYWLLHKRLPDELWLRWAETAWVKLDDDSVPDEHAQYGLRLTGRTESFKTTRTLKDVLAMGVRCRKAWAGIQELTAREWDIAI